MIHLIFISGPSYKNTYMYVKLSWALCNFQYKVILFFKGGMYLEYTSLHYSWKKVNVTYMYI